jgi:hypothetical protein
MRKILFSFLSVHTYAEAGGCAELASGKTQQICPSSEDISNFANAKKKAWNWNTIYRKGFGGHKKRISVFQTDEKVNDRSLDSFGFEST